MRLRRKNVGEMEVNKPIDITDPCYDSDVWCRMNGVDIKCGKYKCVVWTFNEKYTVDSKEYISKRVGIIAIYHSSLIQIPKQNEMVKIGSIGVDAGLAGFFVDKKDYNDGEWDRFCNHIYKDNKNEWIYDGGFFYTSGYGDGNYCVYANKNNNNEIDALEIRFV